jgi:ABC-type Fe3+ transport system substrate-binding protein
MPRFGQRRYGTWVGILGMALVLVASGCGSSSSGSEDAVTALAQDTSEHRTQDLVSAAQKEQELDWYTTVIPDQLANPLARAFEQKYPYLHVKIYRADSDGVSQRVIQEYQARRHDVDIVDGTGTASILAAAHALAPFKSPELDAYPDNLKDQNGLWGTELQYFMVLGYNTTQVSKEDVPKSYQDLLDPKWRGKLAWSTSPGSGAPTFVGNILQSMGQDKGMQYLTQLAGQQIHNLDSSGRAVLDQVISGQFPIALQIFNDQAAFSASKGAPVAWQPLDPVYPQLSRISLARFAPHPGAAMLFLDFMFSEEGQQIVRAGGGIPASPKVQAQLPSLKPGPDTFQIDTVNPDLAFQKSTQWNDTYKKLFR